MKTAYSYQSICTGLQEQRSVGSFLNKENMLKRMISYFPWEPWANIELLKWHPEDHVLPVEYAFYDSPFGEVLVANTRKAACYLSLVKDKPEEVLADLKKRFKYTTLQNTTNSQQRQVIGFLEGKEDQLLQLHLKGTPYQTDIWRKLLQIPFGKVVSYATLGGSNPYARAAGTANGRNPVFYIVPCHRVINTSGAFERYFWGKEVKEQLLAWEFVHSPL